MQVIRITISEMLEEVLNEIISMGPIQASALVTNNGLMMAYKINSNSVDADTIGALVAMLTRSAVHTAKELNKGEIEYLLLNTKKGQIIILKADANSILTVITDQDADVDLTIEEMRRACKKIMNILTTI